MSTNQLLGWDSCLRQSGIDPGQRHIPWRAGNSHGTPDPTVVGLNLGARGSPRAYQPHQEWQDQKANWQGHRPPDKDQWPSCTVPSPQEKRCQRHTWKSKYPALHARLYAHTTGGVLEVRLTPQDHARLCHLPPVMRETMVLQRHTLALLGWGER